MSPQEIIAKYSLDKRDWIKKGFHGVLHYYFPVGLTPLKPLMEYYGDSCELTLYLLHDDFGEWHWNHADLTRLRRSFIEKVNEDPGVLDRLLSDWHQRLRDMDRAMERIDATDLSGLDDQALMAIYVDFNGKYVREFGISIGIQDAFSMCAEEFLAPIFRTIIEGKGRGAEFNPLYELLMSPVDESFVTQEYRAMLGLVSIVGDLTHLNAHEERLFELHAARYCWMGNNYAMDLNLGKEHFLREAVSLRDVDVGAELEGLDAKLRTIKAEKAKVMDELGLDEEARLLVRIAEVFAYMQDERKKYVLKAVHYQDKFLVEIAKRLGLDMEEAKYTFIDELPGMLSDRQKIDRAALQERKSFVMVINTLDSHEMVTGKEAERIYDQIFKAKDASKEEIKGTVASGGSARGRVRVIHKIQDMANMGVGEILVASMTRPEMLPAMKKAAAIVTDEGGVTCHAAIVSRELGIPCIIGTKIATNALKDGDEVEVDAGAGLVRIIRRT